MAFRTALLFVVGYVLKTPIKVELTLKFGNPVITLSFCGNWF